MVSCTQNNPEKLVKAALLSGRITHSHPVSDAASIAGAYAVKLALVGVEPGEMYESLLNIQGFLRIYQRLENVLRISSLWYGSKILKELGQGSYADETFALAYFCILRYPNGCKKAVQNAVNITEDSDFVGGVQEVFLEQSWESGGACL